MQLNVPLVRQQKDSVECGLAALAMLLGYHGIKATQEELKKEIALGATGTYSPQLASYLLKKGFDVEIITMNPGLFTNKDKGKSQKGLLAHFQALRAGADTDKKKKALDYFIAFMNEGGKVKAKIPDKKDIFKELKNKRPALALLTANFLSGAKADFDFHYNVITGIEGKYVHANDPKWDERGGKKKHLLSDLLFGIYASAYGDLDNACLITARKKKRSDKL